MAALPIRSPEAHTDMHATDAMWDNITRLVQARLSFVYLAWNAATLAPGYAVSTDCAGLSCETLESTKTSRAFAPSPQPSSRASLQPTRLPVAWYGGAMNRGVRGLHAR